MSKADRAEFKIGIAAARSVSHSSLIALATAACSFATASSALTTLMLSNNFLNLCTFNQTKERGKGWNNEFEKTILFIYKYLLIGLK